MKECKDCNRWHKVYWDWKEWINSIYPTALKWLILSLIFIILIIFDEQADKAVVNILTSVYTGILSSVIVTVLIQKRQDKLSMEKKRAVLFDAGFLLDEFSKNYQALETKNDCLEVYRTCKKAASYLSNLYTNHVDVFDVMELNYLRAINASLVFINKLANANSSELVKSNELTIEVAETYSEMVGKLIDNLLNLIIKWNCDGIIDIKLR